MNNILLIIGQILLGILVFLIGLFILFWITIYRDRGHPESRGIHRIFSTFKEAVYLAYVGLLWGGMFIYMVISDRLGYKVYN